MTERTGSASLKSCSEAIKGRWAGAGDVDKPSPIAPTLFETPARLQITNNVLRADHCSYQIRNITSTMVRGHIPSNSFSRLFALFGVLMFVSGAGLVFSRPSDSQLGLTLVGIGIAVCFVAYRARQQMAYSFHVHVASGSELRIKTHNRDFVVELAETIDRVMEEAVRREGDRLCYEVDVAKGVINDLRPDDERRTRRRPVELKPVSPHPAHLTSARARRAFNERT